MPVIDSVVLGEYRLVRQDDWEMVIKMAQTSRYILSVNRRVLVLFIIVEVRRVKQIRVPVYKACQPQGTLANLRHLDHILSEKHYMYFLKQ